MSEQHGSMCPFNGTSENCAEQDQQHLNFGDFGKLSRFRLNAIEHGVSSGSALFAKIKTVFKG